MYKLITAIIQRDFLINNKTKMKTMREEAMNWWDNLSSLRKTQICDINTNIVGFVRRWETLTGREIEDIWKSEMLDSLEVGMTDMDSGIL